MLLWFWAEAGYGLIVRSTFVSKMQQAGFYLISKTAASKTNVHPRIWGAFLSRILWFMRVCQDEWSDG